MNRRTALTLLAGSALSACRRTPAALRTIRVISTPNISVAPLFVADELGYFAAAGLRIEAQVLGEPTQMIPLVAAGRADVAFSGVNPTSANAVLKGARVRVVACRDAAVKGCTHEIHGRRASFPNGFKDAGELKGKRVAVTATSSLTAFVLDTLLASAGLQTSDVDRVIMRQSESTPALLAGKLDASVDMDRNYASQDIIAGPSLAQLLPGFQYSYIQFGESLLDGDVAVGAAFLRAYLRGVREFRAGYTPRALERLAADSGMSPVAVQNACRERLPEDGRVDPVSVQRLLDWAVKNGFIPESLDAARLIDARFLDHPMPQAG